MKTIIESAKEDLLERIRGYRSEFYQGEPHDVIHEVADSSVPCYTAELLRLAHEDLHLATEEPELGPAFDGSPTPTNIIAANVFERIEAALWEYWQDEGEALFQEYETADDNLADIIKIRDNEDDEPGLAHIEIEERYNITSDEVLDYIYLKDSKTA